MTTELSPVDEALLAAVSTIDVMDLAGSIIANPRRARVSLAGELALALAVERLQSVAIEAGLLINALALPDGQDEHARNVKQHAVETQIDRVRTHLISVYGNPQDN